MQNEGYTCFSTDLEGENLYEFNFPDKSFIIFSNEANGPAKDVLKAVDKKLNIPKFGSAESLNVASASAVIISEISRRKSFGK